MTDSATAYMCEYCETNVATHSLRRDTQYEEKAKHYTLMRYHWNLCTLCHRKLKEADDALRRGETDGK